MEKNYRNQRIAVPANQNNPEQWAAEDKLAVVIETSSLNEVQLSEYCRSKGLYPEQIHEWKTSALSVYKHSLQVDKEKPRRNNGSQCSRLDRFALIKFQVRKTSLLVSNKFYFILAVIPWLFFPNFAMPSPEESLMSQTRPSTSVEEPALAEEPALSVNEPLYLIFGGDDDIKGRFQFSFKYLIFDEDSSIVRYAGWLEGFHFAYTQTSLWNLSEDSLPFEDTSYRPSFFWEFYSQNKNYLPVYLRAGYEHESNGQGDEASRSLESIIFWPFWNGELAGHDWVIAPKFISYLSKGSENKDIDDYRGYIDLWLRYGNENGWLLSMVLRQGNENHNMTQLDLSYPIRKKIFSRTGGYIYMQLFQGYGESLLTYDTKQDLQVRAGFAIVR